MSALLFAFSTGGAEGGGNPLTMFIPIIMVFIVFYLHLIRPQQKKQKEHQALLGALGKGDKVVTNGGLYGVISDTKETDSSRVARNPLMASSSFDQSPNQRPWKVRITRHSRRSSARMRNDSSTGLMQNFARFR